MKVAIMGAGMSGLSCAIMLERHGIKPTIFEKRSQVGDRFINGEALLSLLYRPVNDPISYLSNEYNIHLKPTSHISQMDIYSENSHCTINEFMGYINIRGRHHLSFEKQLAEQLDTEIIFDADHSYEELLENYTHVILATGDASYAMKLNNFNEEVSVTIKGATVEGNFDRSQTLIWLDNQLAPNGYGYILPYSNNEACLSIAIPDLPEGFGVDIDTLWDRFYKQVRHKLKQEFPITDQFQITNYQIGLCKKPRIGNTFFVGNNFGTITPFLGFGQFESILTGIYSAYVICGLGDYDQLTKPLRQSHHDSYTLRLAMQKLSNSQFDFIVKQLDHQWAEKLFTPSRFNTLKVISKLLKPLLNEK